MTFWNRNVFPETMNDMSQTTPKSIPPCGHIAGIYVSCDRNVGVHSAPANKMGHVLRDRDLI